MTEKLQLGGCSSLIWFFYERLLKIEMNIFIEIEMRCRNIVELERIITAIL